MQTTAAPMRVLDLFCGAGGAAMGLHRAWPDALIVGVDIRPQPHYPFLFVQSDAVNPPVRVSDFDFIWASPPCEHFTLSNNKDVRNLHPDLIEPVRALLKSSGAGWCMENVPHAPIRPDLVLDGTMFPGLKVIRRRHFELSFPAPLALGFNARNHVGEHGWKTALDGTLSSHSRASRRRHGLKEYDAPAEVAQAMGIDWTNDRRGVGQAIPPAYSEFIARQFK